MRRRILTLIRKDFDTARRDQLITYLLLSPVLLGVLLAIVMSFFEDAGLVFAVQDTVAPADIEVLQQYGRVDLYDSAADVRQRVAEYDDVPGVIAGAGGVSEIVVQGDEPEAVRDLPAAVLEHAARGGAAYARQTGADSELPLRAVGTSLLGYCVIVIVGLALGFTILEEKTTNAIAVAAVSPVRFWEYAVAKIGLGLVLSLVLVPPAVVFGTGTMPSWPSLALVTIAGFPFAFALGLFVGAFAKDQLGAIAIMKATLPVWTSLPIAAFVVDPSWQWTLAPFANHWGVQAFFSVLTSGDIPLHAAGYAVLTGAPVLLASLWFLRSKTGLR